VNKVFEEQVGSTVEQQAARYRQRIRAKLQARGVPAEELDQRTEELMQRSPVRFNMADVAKILSQ
jgi:hypothetical protein